MNFRQNPARYPTNPNHNAMKYLTKEQQIVLCVILLLLLTGLGVKTWRTAHPTQALPSKQPNQAGK